jgi:hypothetical protein
LEDVRPQMALPKHPQLQPDNANAMIDWVFDQFT